MATIREAAERLLLVISKWENSPCTIDLMGKLGFSFTSTIKQEVQTLRGALETDGKAAEVRALADQVKKVSSWLDTITRDEGSYHRSEPCEVIPASLSYENDFGVEVGCLSEDNSHYATFISQIKAYKAIGPPPKKRDRPNAERRRMRNEAVKLLFANDWKQKDIACAFRLSESTISSIVRSD